MTPEYLEELADLADPDQLWRLGVREQMQLPADRRRQLDAGRALRRHADDVRLQAVALVHKKSILITPLFVNGRQVQMVDSPQAQTDGPLNGKYGEVLRPFVALMERELHANSDKGDRPGWLSMDANTALLEVYWHVAKLSAAVKNNDGPRIEEHSADVANMAMMVLDVCGGIAGRDAAPTETAPQPEATAKAAGGGVVEALRYLLAVHTEPAGLTMSVVCDKKQFKEFMDASNQRVAVAVEKAKTALAAHEAAQGDAGDAVAACPVCNGTGVIFGHSDDCADDLCALNGDMHSCAGQVHQCDCRATQPPAVESGPSDEDLFRVAAETLPHRGKRTPFGLIAFESPDYARAMCIEDGVRWTYTELRSEDYLKLARALLSAFPAAQPQPTGEEIRRDAELLSKYADEINALRNVIQLACIDGLEGLARGWSKYFPDSPITIKGLPQQTDAAIEAVRKALCKIPKYSFQIDNRGNLRRNEDSAGNWIEFAAAHALFDPVEVDAAIAASKETPQ